MMYPYMTFHDGTEVTHSQMLEDGSVKVYIETPVEDGFKNLTCWLPKYQYENHGYDEKELTHWKEFIQKHAHRIMALDRGQRKEN
jgi:acylphosphatase